MVVTEVCIRVPIRERSALAAFPPRTEFGRKCNTCGCEFMDAGRVTTGFRGIWRDWRWYCSTECAEEVS